jgi:biopolymer transport protein TolQ
VQPIPTITAEPLPVPGSGLDWRHVLAEGGPVTFLVLGILLAFSVLSWAIILGKWLSLRRAERQSRAFLEVFRRSKKFSEVRAVAIQLAASPLVSVFLAGYNELEYQLRAKNPGTEENEPSRVRTVRSFDGLTRALVRAANAEGTKLENRLGFLATTGSATPFIGLFGTVWGIMTAFQRIGATQSANISVVAPGVSEALIATAAGLAVAIPAVIFYNHLLMRARRLSAEMDDFALEFLSIVERNFGG